jgi:hypothetical protein
MARRPNLPEDVQQLVSLIRSGKLFALQDWIKAGKRIRSSEICDDRAHILCLAAKTGFHSILEELLKAGGWSLDELTETLSWTLDSRRLDLSDLLFSHSAKASELDFEIVCRTMDFSLMERFLREGGDPSKDNAFGRALRDMKARPLLRFYKSFRADFSSLDDQAALALYDAVANEQVRWTALLAWAGADPFRPVPWNFDDPFPVDPECNTCAATRATWRCNPEILKVLKLRPTAAQAIELLSDAVSSANVELFRTVLKQVPTEQVNSTPHGSSEALERVVSHWAHRDVWSSIRTNKGDDENLQCMQMLLDMGARWNPAPDEIRHMRRNLKEHEPRYIVQVLRLLLYTPGAADLESVLQLCDSAAFRTKIAEADQPLLREIKDLRKQHKKLPA